MDDKLKIYNQSEMYFSDNVEIKGHVKKPGIKQFLKNMTLSDLVFMGGGFEDSDFLKKTYMKRADLVRAKENELGSKSLLLISVRFFTSG